MRSPSRLDTSPLARWFWSIDRVSLTLIAAIVLIGAVLLLAAGPAAAARLNIADSFYFPFRQLVFLGPALLLMLFVSTLSPLQARRLGAAVFAAAALLIVIAVLFGPEINGAKRWLSFGVFAVQPSEFAKPGFVIVAAWMLAEGARNPQFPGAAISLALYLFLMAMLVMQPDYGQAALVTAVWMTMFFIAGSNILWIAGLGFAGIGGLIGGYFFSPHLARRIDAFLNPEAGETYQVDKAMQAIAHGGPFGVGSESATVKMGLPDAHTDFIFAVAGEEGGFILCVVILALFCALTVRLFIKSTTVKSVFAQCAVCGLAAMIGLQSFINMAVNLRALPAKGMTLPFISYGGSSLLATGLAFGLALALSRAQGPVRSRKEIMP